jgi:hypothetical protein
MPAFYWKPAAPRDEKPAKTAAQRSMLSFGATRLGETPGGDCKQSTRQFCVARLSRPSPICGKLLEVPPVGPWRSWERASMASRRSWVRIPSAPPKSHFLYCSAGSLLSWLLHHLFDFPYGSARSTPLTPTPIGATRTTAYLASTKEGRVFHRQLTASSPIQSVCHPHKCLFLNRLVFFSHVTPVTFFRPAETLSSGRHIHR